MSKFNPKYSGERSIVFWEEVNKGNHSLYHKALRLQKAESDVLDILNKPIIHKPTDEVDNEAL